jgi:hypothetical protein
MNDKSYFFDPCDLDEEDKLDDGITLDNWKPRDRKKGLVQSDWRQNQIGKDFDQQPGIDDITKIESFLRKKVSDPEIMKYFGISADTLVAIKKGTYCPVEGIHLDNLSKIQKEFKTITRKLSLLQRGADYISKILFISEEDLKQYNDYCKNKRPRNYPENQKDQKNQKKN